MWHEVALGETGSIIVQNIFENCLEEDKVSSLDYAYEFSRYLLAAHTNICSAPVSMRSSSQLI